MGAAPALIAQQRRKPNVILLMTDDQGYGDLGCHGNPWVRTPNLDRLYGQSVRFSNYHTDPLCAPTRSALLTGQYALGNGVTAATGGYSLLRPGVKTAADMFRAAGYRTGIFGKWHLGENYPLRPSDRGFEESVVCRGGGIAQAPDYWGNDYFDDTFYVQNQPKKFQGYCTDVFFAEASRFVTENRERPFFLYLPTNAPHDPYQVDEKYSAAYRKLGVPEAPSRFYGMIENLDENTGRLLKLLDRLGLREDTIFIFSTDNGSSAGTARPGQSTPTWAGYSAGMRAQKASVYEGGHRTPLFIRYPRAGWKVNRSQQELVCHLDVLPTLAGLCGVPTGTDHRLDGQSLEPLLSQRGSFSQVRTHFVEHHQTRKDLRYEMEHPEPWKNAVAMRGPWRLVYGRELYDVSRDPRQEADIAAKHPEVVADLRKKYEAWWRRMEVGFRQWNRVTVGNAAEEVCGLTCFDWHGEYVPSSQKMVSDNLVANGVWATTVERAGLFEVMLRQRPEYVSHTVQAETANLWVNGRQYTQAVGGGLSGVPFRVELPRGAVDLKTELVQSGIGRGAYYTDVRRIGESEKKG